MAKTKWIVPAVALMLCAVSLIGAGYAAYSATLRDTEDVAVQNNYLKLTLGTNTADKPIVLDYGQDITYSNRAFSGVTYTLNAVSDAVMFYIDLDAEEVEQTGNYGKTTDGYTLTAPTVTFKNTAEATVALSPAPTFSVYLTDGSGNITGQALSPGTLLSYDNIYAIVMNMAAGQEFEYTSSTYADANAAFAAFAAAIPVTASISITATAHVQ